MRNPELWLVVATSLAILLAILVVFGALGWS